jgi:hypothetical protein
VRVKFGRTDRLSPAEREIVDRFERGAIDATEAARLLIASVQRADAPVVAAEPDEAAEDEHHDETPEAAAARELVERIAREVDEETGSSR